METNHNQFKVVNSVLHTVHPEIFQGRSQIYQEYMMMYNCAIKEIVTKFEILNDELKVRNNRSPIEFIQSRVKSPDSLREKMNRKGYELEIDSIKYIEDIAGVRIICSFIDDIYEVAQMLLKQDDIVLISCKDYIQNPKENGYRSYHMIVEVPVFFSNIRQPLKVEVQIRTIAMDFWASLEHQLKYKKHLHNEEQLTKKLQNCAKVIAETDMQMQEIRKEIDENNQVEA